MVWACSPSIVFAAEPPSGGLLRGSISTLDLDPAILKEQPQIFRESLMHYGYVDPRLNRFILCCDDARFINHSDAPNVGPDLTDDVYGIDVARDIEHGEEITVDTCWSKAPDPPPTGHEWRCRPLYVWREIAC
jgi:hypothetical protein